MWWLGGCLPHIVGYLVMHAISYMLTTYIKYKTIVSFICTKFILIYIAILSLGGKVEVIMLTLLYRIEKLLGTIIQLNTISS